MIVCKEENKMKTNTTKMVRAKIIQDDNHKLKLVLFLTKKQQEVFCLGVDTFKKGNSLFDELEIRTQI